MSEDGESKASVHQSGYDNPGSGAEGASRGGPDANDPGSNPFSIPTDDLIFEWYPPESIPLVVEPLQLPQLELIHNTTEDCTTSYSTGQMADMSRQ